jgi:hypothetical protein
VPGYFLGPLLNHLPELMVPSRTLLVHGEKGVTTIVVAAKTAGFAPQVTVSETQSLLVILGYSVVFAVVAVVLTWRRDVLE